MNRLNPIEDFELVDQKGQQHRLYDALDKGPVVLFFYPYDQSPNCSKQLCSINQELDTFKDTGITVWGVNNASAESHQHFASKNLITMPLLSDNSYSVSKKFGCLFEIGPIKVIRRTIIGIGMDRKILFYNRGSLSSKQVVSQILANSKPK
jgi:peroxiredoxin